MESDLIQIVEYNSKYKEDFVRLNEEWITTYFDLETADVELFSNPEIIITQGGHIFFALYNQEVVGTVALIKEDDAKKYELAKMAIAPKNRSIGIGKKLLNYVINYAKTNQYPYLYLVSNTKLVPAINLYEKAGFKPVPIQDTVYSRGNYRAEMFL